MRRRARRAGKVLGCVLLGYVALGAAACEQGVRTEQPQRQGAGGSQTPTVSWEFRVDARDSSTVVIGNVTAGAQAQDASQDGSTTASQEGGRTGPVTNTPTNSTSATIPVR